MSTFDFLWMKLLLPHIFTLSKNRIFTHEEASLLKMIRETKKSVNVAPLFENSVSVIVTSTQSSVI